MIFLVQICPNVKREEVKIELAQEYQKHKEATGEFINAFCEKHKLDLPSDLFFDIESLFKIFLRKKQKD